MMWTRRQFVLTGGVVTLTGLQAPRQGHAEEVVDIVMDGTTGGAHVWFRPVGLLIQPGQTVRWTNQDKGNSHTATAYHPAFFGKPQRIPQGAQPWDSGFLLPGESFSVTLTVPGVYDYYCLPHELAGMVGRIVVGKPGPRGSHSPPYVDQGMPASALQNLPPVDRIIKEKIVSS